MITNSTGRTMLSSACVYFSGFSVRYPLAPTVMSPLCRAVRAWAYSCRQSETIQAAVTNRNTATPGCSANPVQVAQPVTAVTARMPRKTGLTRRSPRRVVAVVMELLGSRTHGGMPDRTGPGGKTSRDENPLPEG